MNIASVEDDPSQAELIQQILIDAGHECDSFSGGKAFLRAMRERAYDLLVMDWQLPDISGYDVVTHVRQQSGQYPPILFLTSRSLEEDIVTGLAGGADDYMIKPVRRGELVARVTALLRRSYPTAPVNDDIVVAGYRIDPVARTVSLNGEEVDIAPREFDLALYLFRNMDRLLPRDVVEQAVWGRSLGAGSRTLDTHLSRVRIKLGLRPENGVRLSSVYSYGYRFERCAGASDGV
ncbi:DNA-binding response OmpR family regulator [Cupriavidus gilardii J11]|uniref:DNA-binding response OmpR family regulator n=1 Tax=Cupriavidus gilardii J11 TaxID=936133 RepID=A0A562BJ34_9BURK|nr:response regulator transcription factor [Cupriavidus gilardii]TWG84920.1 DNA-binding response OmpR family regulator [Cupriavidus gilardii J11]